MEKELEHKLERMAIEIDATQDIQFQTHAIVYIVGAAVILSQYRDALQLSGLLCLMSLVMWFVWLVGFVSRQKKKKELKAAEAEARLISLIRSKR